MVQGLAPVRLPDHSDKGETWHATVADKKILYGSARVNVAGGNDGGEETLKHLQRLLSRGGSLWPPLVVPRGPSTASLKGPRRPSEALPQGAPPRGTPPRWGAPLTLS